MLLCRLVHWCHSHLLSSLQSELICVDSICFNDSFTQQTTVQWRSNERSIVYTLSQHRDMLAVPITHGVIAVSFC